MTKMTYSEFIATLTERFGSDPSDWAFVCPRCGDIATGRDMRDALAEHPQTNRDGSAKRASHILGRECIGRTLGALSREPYTGRGCDWAAYGLLHGPLFVIMDDGREVAGFHIAEAVA